MYAWTDASEQAGEAGLLRSMAIVHEGWQIAAGGYAANGATRVDAVEPPAGWYTRLYSTSCGVFGLTSQSGTMTLERSTDGIQAFSTVLTTAAGRMSPALPLLIDCGSSRLVIVEYTTDNLPSYDNEARLWYSADGGDSWALLLTSYAGAIRHFHGGFWDARTERLFLFTGDSGDAASILVCDDLADLVANAAQWRTWWGLTDAARSTLDTDYVLGYGSQQLYRTVGMIAEGDYLLYGVDSYGPVGGVPMVRVHRDTLAVTELEIPKHAAVADVGKVVGEIWSYGRCARTGTVLIGNQAHDPGAPYQGDNHMHLYASTPGRIQEAREVLAMHDGGAVGVLCFSIEAVGDLTILSPYFGSFDALAGYVGQPTQSRNAWYK